MQCVGDLQSINMNAIQLMSTILQTKDIINNSHEFAAMVQSFKHCSRAFSWDQLYWSLASEFVCTLNFIIMNRDSNKVGLTKMSWKSGWKFEPWLQTYVKHCRYHWFASYWISIALDYWWWIACPLQVVSFIYPSHQHVS